MNKTINELVALTELANDDELIVYDVSEETSKKIKKSDFVTTSIASGNQKPPTSDTVEKRMDKIVYDNYNTDQNNPIDVFSIILTMPLGKVSNLRIGGYCTNAPVGSGVVETDFFYTVYRLSTTPNFLQVVAYSVRDNYISTISYTNGTWNAWQSITKPQVVSRTICTPLGVSALFNNDGIDCLTDCKYIDGMHHVSGLINFNPSRESNGFQISATPDRIITTGNQLWVNGNTSLGTTVICRITNDTVLWWNGDQITTNNIPVSFDFWYKEA